MLDDFVSHSWIICHIFDCSSDIIKDVIRYFYILVF